MPRQKFLTAHWRRLILVNYPAPPEVLAPWLPQGTELDTWQGHTFVSLVGFAFLKTRLLGLPVPGHCNFPEVNLRFYVRCPHSCESRRGVTFIRELVPRRAVAWVARYLCGENYLPVPMSYRPRGLLADWQAPGELEYAWTFAGERYRIFARVEGKPAVPLPGSHEDWIVNQQWGYSGRPGEVCREYHVEHPPWRLWPARDLTLEGDFSRLYGPALGAVLAAPPYSALVADGSAVSVSFPARRAVPVAGVAPAAG